MQKDSELMIKRQEEKNDAEVKRLQEKTDSDQKRHTEAERKMRADFKDEKDKLVSKHNSEIDWY